MRKRLSVTATCLLLPLSMTGCTQTIPVNQGLSNDDFVEERADDTVVEADHGVTTVSADANASSTASNRSPEADPPVISLGSSDDRYAEQSNPQAQTLSTDQSWTIDGMVGQVNGRAIYARTILEPLELLLARNAQELSRTQFEREARRAVAERIREIIQNQLMLASAERDLDEQQRMILSATLRYQRDEFIRLYGRGSLAVAEQQLQLREGMSLEDKIEEFRQQWLIHSFQVKHLRPLINIRRRDIERYYREHFEDYNPPSTQTIRMVRVADEAQAERVMLALAADYTFEEIASTSANQILGGGLLENLVGDEPLREPTLNEAIASLDPGEWAGPLVIDDRYIFIQLVERKQPESKSLTEAQMEIRDILLSRQLRQLSSKHQDRLLSGSNYTPVEQMLNIVMDIVMTRYAITATVNANTLGTP